MWRMHRCGGCSGRDGHDGCRERSECDRCREAGKKLMLYCSHIESNNTSFFGQKCENDILNNHITSDSNNVLGVMWVFEPSFAGICSIVQI